MFTLQVLRDLRAACVRARVGMRAIHIPSSCYILGDAPADLQPWNRSLAGAVRAHNRSLATALPQSLNWYWPHSSYMLREFWSQLVRPGGRLELLAPAGPNAANVCLGDCGGCEKPFLERTGSAKFPIFGSLVFPRCHKNVAHCCRVQLLNELFPTPSHAAQANCSVVVPYLTGVHGGGGGMPPWDAVEARGDRPVLLTFVGGSHRGPGARGDYLRNLEKAAAAAANQGGRRVFVPLYTDHSVAASPQTWSPGYQERGENDKFYSYMWRAYADAVFSLQPPGDTATRRGFYDSWMHGCIPVVTAQSALQRAGPLTRGAVRSARCPPLLQLTRHPSPSVAGTSACSTACSFGTCRSSTGRRSSSTPGC